MKTYKIKYVIDGKKRCVKRIAYNAVEAIDKMSIQYGWNWRLSMVDAETNGMEWCCGLVDRNCGINYNMRIVASEIR